MRLSLEYFLNFTNTTFENTTEDKGHFYVVATFRKSDNQFDIGHFTLLFVKFINDFVLHSIL